MRANESWADIIVRVGVGSRASFLEPEECWLHNSIPVGVPVLATLSSRVSGDIDSLLFPVNTTAASLISTWLVAWAYTSATVKVKIHEVILRSWEASLAVEGRSVGWDNTANLISSPESKVSTAGFLKEVSMTRVEADSADLSSDFAFIACLASITTSSNLVVVIGGWLQVPRASTNFGFRIFRAWVSTEILIIRLQVSINWAEGNWKWDSIDNFHIVEVNSVFQESHFSLSCWLTKSSRWHASSLVISTVSYIANSIWAVSSSCHDSTPNDVFSIINDWDWKILGLAWGKFVISISWDWILPETLANRSCLDAVGSFKAISISTTRSASRWTFVSGWATSSSKPNRLIAQVTESESSIGLWITYIYLDAASTATVPTASKVIPSKLVLILIRFFYNINSLFSEWIYKGNMRYRSLLNNPAL